MKLNVIGALAYVRAHLMCPALECVLMEMLLWVTQSRTPSVQKIASWQVGFYIVTMAAYTQAMVMVALLTQIESGTTAL